MLPSATSPPVSPESDNSKGKPNITKSNLKEHGIEYDPAILDCSAADGTANGRLPQSVIGVGKLLSDFTRELIHQDRKELLEDDLTKAMKRRDFTEIVNGDSWCLLPPETAFWKYDWPDDEDDNAFQSVIGEQIVECRKIAKEIINLRESSEHEWTQKLREHLFRKFEGTERTRETVE